MILKISKFWGEFGNVIEEGPAEDFWLIKNKISGFNAPSRRP